MDLLAKMATYVRVVEAGSLSAAAKQLRISTAATSRQLAVLERELGASLLLRSTRRMSITPLGQRYYERCLRILREVDAAQAIGRGAGLDGLLRINAPVTFGLAWLVPRMHDLLVKHAALRVDLRLEDRFVDLALEGVDVAIRVGRAPPESTDVIAHKLLEFDRVVVASPAYLAQHGEPKTPAALAAHAALAHAGDTDHWAFTSGRGKTARVALRVAFRSNALHALRELAVRGAGVTVLPRWFARDEIARGELRVVLSAWQSGPVAVHALHRTAQRGESRVRALIDHLRAG